MERAPFSAFFPIIALAAALAALPARAFGSPQSTLAAGAGAVVESGTRTEGRPSVVNGAINLHGHKIETRPRYSSRGSRPMTAGHATGDITLYADKAPQLGIDVAGSVRLYGGAALWGSQCGPGGAYSLDLKAGGSTRVRTGNRGYVGGSIDAGLLCVSEGFLASLTAFAQLGFPTSGVGFRGVVGSGPFEAVGQVRWGFYGERDAPISRDESLQLRGRLGAAQGSVYLGLDARRETHLQAVGDDGLSKTLSGAVVIGGTLAR